MHTDAGLTVFPMKTSSGMHLRFLCLLVLSGAAMALAEEPTLKLQVGREDVMTLRLNLDPMDDRYFGAYNYSRQGEGGERLHLFPDHTFVITTWADVSPEEALAVGTYTVAMGWLKLTIVRQTPEAGNVEHRFAGLRMFYGVIEKENYVTGFEVFLLGDKILQELVGTQMPRTDYLVRRREYVDWQKISRDFRQGLKK